MGSSKRSDEHRDRKRKKEKSKKRKRDHSKERHRHKHKKHKRREERTPSISLSDLSDSDLDGKYEEMEVSEEVPRAPRHEPQKKQQNEISMSVEETNKIRAKLGLKPLQEESNVKIQEDTEGEYKAFEEVHKPPENLADKLQINKLREKIAAQREKRIIQNNLRKVKGLGASDSEDDTAISWVKKSRKISKERLTAEKKDKMLQELDEQFGFEELVREDKKDRKKLMYDTNNLSGLKVLHDTSRFETGNTTILTLQDSNILQDEEDALVNVNIIDQERVEKSLKNKRQMTETVEYDAPEVDEYGKIVQNTILKKYDEEIGKYDKRSFRIGRGGEGTFMDREEKKLSKIQKLRQLQSLDTPASQLATEYLAPGEVGFKKVKRKKKRKMLKADDLLPEVKEEDEDSLRNLVEDDTKSNLKTDVDYEVEEDNYDIELKEARARAERVKEEAFFELPLKSIKEEPSMNVHEQKNKEYIDMSLNITDEFCRTLGDIPTYGLSGNRAKKEGLLLEPPSPPKEKEKQGAWEEVDIENTKVEISNGISVPILEEEPTAGSGVAAALELASKKGYLEKQQTNKPANAGLQHLRAVNYSIEDKALEEDRRASGGRNDRYAGPIVDFREKEGYKPEIKLEYVDDDGRKLDHKEAFRYLSHRFHGKGSGKNKLEKRMKKMKEEMSMKHMSSSDTPLQTAERQREKHKQLQSAYIVLTGNKTQETLNIKK